MRNVRTMLSFVILILPLSACETFKQPALTGSAPTIRNELARICPMPSNLTPAQAGQVADAIEATAPEHIRGITILATEWDRLDNGAKICRGDPP